MSAESQAEIDSGARTKILIVDDRPENIFAMKQILKPMKAELFSAESGNDGLALLLHHEFAVALLDVQMPEMDGYEMAELMQGNENMKHVPIIFVTAINKDSELIFKGYESGAVDYLFKPVVPEILLSKVQVFIDLHEQRNVIEKQNAELELFAHTAAHDLKAPIRTVGQLCDWVLTDNGELLPEESKGHLSNAMERLGGMDTLLDDLLEFATAANTKPKLEPVALNDIAKNVVTSLQADINEVEGVVTFEDLPTVMGDQTGLNQLIQNLISNALKFSKDRTPAIEISAVKKDGMWMIGVKDNGIGIKLEDQERVFAAFKRLNSNSEFKGSGIGLATCLKIVDRFGGRIWVESEFGTGTTFFFTLRESIQPVAST